MSGAERQKEEHRRALARERGRRRRLRERRNIIVLRDVAVSRWAVEDWVDLLRATGYLPVDEAASMTEVYAAIGKAFSRAKISVTRDAFGVTAHVVIRHAEDPKPNTRTASS
jgi:hypothetical protein